VVKPPIIPTEAKKVAKSVHHGEALLINLVGNKLHFAMECGIRSYPIAVDDADTYFEEWREQVDVLRPPENESWGVRTFDLLDPFGNTIFVMGPTK
jgi:uncharacterized glyoxalase superfamily protein PhnB